MADALELRCTDPGFDRVQRDFDKLPKSMQKIVLEGSAVGRQFQKMEGKMSSAGKTGKSALGGIGNEMIGIVSSAVSVAGSLAAIKSGLQQLHEERKRGAQAVSTEAEAVRRYGQLTQDPKEIRRMRETGETIAASKDIDPLLAHDFVFSMESIGADAIKMSELFNVASAEGARKVAEGATAIRASMGKQEGNGPALVNMILAAASSSVTTSEEFAPGVLRIAPGAGRMGTTAEDAMAALSATSLVAELSPEIAGTQLASFARRMAEQNMQGTFLENAKKVQDMNLSEADLKSFLGREQAVAAYVNLTKPEVQDQYHLAKKATAEARQRTGTERVDAAGNWQGDYLMGSSRALDIAAPDIAAAREKGKQERLNALSEKIAYGEEQLRVEAEKARLHRELRESGAGGPTRLAAGAVAGGLDILGGGIEDQQRWRSGVMNLREQLRGGYSEIQHGFERQGRADALIERASRSIARELAAELEKQRRREPPKAAQNIEE